MNNFDNLFNDLNSAGYPRVELGALGRIFSGLTGKSKEDFKEGNHKYVAYTDISNNPTLPVELSNFVRVRDGERQNQIKEGDVLVTGSSETPNEVGLTSAVLTEPTLPTYLNSFCFGFRPEPGTLLPSFASHIFRSHDVRRQIVGTANGVTRFNVSKKDFLKVSFCLPPVEVQQEIATILDKFTQLEAELEAELEARRKQYEYYRNQLLTFPTLAQEGVRWAPMGEAVANLDSLRRPVTRSQRSAGEYPYYGANGIQDYVNDYIFDETLLLVGEDGSVINENGTPVVNWSTGKVWVNNHAHVLKSKNEELNLRFLFHYLQTINITAYVTGGSQLKLNQGSLNRIPIPMPRRKVQDDFVAILDRMHALTHDLVTGLPAEIKARRQQYEYYRDRLLTFDELGAA